MASIRDPRLGVDRPEGSRRPRLFGDTFRRRARRASRSPSSSTAVVIGTLVFLVVRSTYWPDFKQQFFNGEEFARSSPRHRRALPAQHPVLPRRRADHPGLGTDARRPAVAPRSGLLPRPAARDDLRGPVQRGPHAVGRLPPRLRLLGAADPRSAGRGVVLGMIGPDPQLLGLRGRGLPGGHRVRAPEPIRSGEGSRPVALADPQVRRDPAGRSACDPAADERLHRPTEGHGPHRGRLGGPYRRPS